MSSYTGGRIVPKHCGVWGSGNEYEMLSIVLNGSTGDSYMARKAVPKGVAITDTEYWAFCADYSAQLSMIASDVDVLETDLKTLKEQVAANVTASTDADADYAAEVVDARTDSEGETYDSLGENIRSATYGLFPKILPERTFVAAIASRGNSGSIELKGRTVVGTYTYSGASYIGLFASFFGAYEDVADKKFRVVIKTDRACAFEPIVVNSISSWGSSDGTTTCLSLGKLSFTEGGGFTQCVDVDFTSTELTDFVSSLDESKRTLYFAIRKMDYTSESMEDAVVYFYCYEVPADRELYWKYVLHTFDTDALRAEIENARNDGTEHDSLGDVITEHREDIDAVTGEVQEARTDSFGLTAANLGERLANMGAALRPRLTVSAIARPRDNYNLFLDTIEGAEMGAEIIRDNAVFYFDSDAYLAADKQYWGTVNFSFSMTNAYMAALSDISNLYLSFKIEGRDSERELYNGESLDITYYVNGHSAWSTVDNPLVTSTVTIGATNLIKLSEEYIQNVIDLGTPLYILFYGNFLNCTAVADMGQVQMTASIVSLEAEVEPFEYLSKSEYAGTADYAQNAAEAEHASEADEADKAAETDHAAEADYATEAGTAKSADNAADAGYSTRDVYVVARNKSSAIESITKDGNGATVVYSPYSMESSMWNYWLATINILDMFGKGVKFIISGTNTGGAYGPAFYKITTTSGSWSNTLITVDVAHTADEDFYFEVDLDSLGIDPSEYTALYLLIGSEKRITTADDDGNYVSEYEGEINFKAVYTDDAHTVIATRLVGFDQNDYYKSDEVDEKLTEVETEIEEMADKVGDLTSIVCWGDSLTAGGGWTTTLQTLSGLTVYNGGTGGETAQTIMARQGGDVMMINNITIPAECEAVTIATMTDDGGIPTQLGNLVTPLLQGSTHVNPVMIGDIEGTLKWTGSSYSDTTGTWTFTRSEAGDEVEITRPTAIRTNFDRIHNGKENVMIIYMGQNGGYSDVDDLIHMHKLMIDHFKGKEYIILGLSSGTASSRADYEAAMKEAFGRRFISLREYLSTALYDEGGNIISCYGLDDQDLEMEEEYTYGSKTYVTADEIAAGTVPHQILADNVHYTTGTKTVVGNLIYKRMVELGILEGA